MPETTEPRNTRWLYAAALTVGLLAAAGGIATWQIWFQPEIRPTFTLPDLDDEPRSITEWDGDLVVLNFWATWCPPCIKEIPVFTALQDDYRDQGVQFVGVAIDRLDDARAFYDELDMNYPSLYGVNDAMDINEAYGNDLGTLPYTVIIGRDGEILHRFPREVTRDEIEPVLQGYVD